ncbi:MAG: type I DNA topoisomerase [Alphaproteobacteria bacterium]|nr:type I DNA topoisomerase [Alphaproteobacteria bacterium]MCB9791171.1 type I DNA topoisomerase [Alphaproteobacteria bacterium]
MGKPLVIVESPAKARTIAKYLGSGYEVAASVGHVRDLPESAADIPKKYKGEKWARTAVDVEHGYAPLYVLTSRGREQVKELKRLLSDAPELYLATDEDREGEAIAWHLTEVLKPTVPTKRLVFHEITERAIKESLSNARELNLDLVHAQETRRIIDRLYGYNVSPVLWKKIRPRLSAGRVQSVAVRMVVERERARMRFVPSIWWDIDADFVSESGAYNARMVELDGKRLAAGRDFEPDSGALKDSSVGKVTVLDGVQAEALRAAIQGRAGAVTDVQRRPFTEKPAPPFTTSTLQQEANRKLRWSARRTMSAAQRLYENGWITYMRTDSVNLSPEALAATRGLIKRHYGNEYVPDKPRVYKTSTKGAQEAHEAIRPAGDQFKSIAEAKRELGSDEAKLYELIWKRTVACQMKNAEGMRVSVETLVESAAGAKALFRATGKTYTFVGFRRVYVEGADDPEAELADQDKLLPPLSKGDVSTAQSLSAQEHSTNPPARLTDATLVKELESEGIGRPSTYASIIETIQSRGYVFKKGTSLVPTWTAFAVTRLLEEHFTGLIDYRFTAQMEDGLDRIAMGSHEPVAYLDAFYKGEGEGQGLTDLVGKAEDKADPREVCSIPIGEHRGHPLVARVGRYGPYLEHDGQTRSLPEDLPPDELDQAKAIDFIENQPEGPQVLGKDPETGLEVALHVGRFGPYVQLGEQEKGSKKKPKRSSLLKNMTVEDLDLDLALQLLSLPRELGETEEGEVVRAYNGRYGPYIKAGKESRSIPPTISLLEITLAQAKELLAQPARRRGSEPLAELGEDAEGRKIVVKSGRFGPYVTDGEVNATLPRGSEPGELTKEQALELLAKKHANPNTKKRKPRRAAPKAKASTAKASAAKRSTTKRSTKAKKK